MSLMEMERPPGRVGCRFAEGFKADAVVLVLDGDRLISHVARDLGLVSRIWGTGSARPASTGERSRV